MPEQVTMFTKNNCGYCVMAKRLLESRGVPFTEINIEDYSSEQIAELFAKTGMRTMPQIMHGEELIGGYNELAARDQGDQLAFMKS